MWLRDTQLGRRARLQADGGFALPTVMLGMLAAFGLATAMVVSSVSAGSGTTRDTNTKSAFSVAEAGASQALLRYNSFTTTAAKPCVTEGPGGQAYLDESGALADPPQPTGWCAPVTATTSGGSYRYDIKPGAAGILIISTGVFDGITRRIKVGTTYVANPPPSGATPFDTFDVIAKDGITLNSGTRIAANVATNGTLDLNSGSRIYCDNAQYGSIVLNSGSSIGCAGTTPNIDVPDVDTTPYRTTNNNSLIGTGCWNYSSVSKWLIVNSGCSITLGQSGVTHNYYFCRLELNSGSRLFIRNGATVNIWFGPPNLCGNIDEPLLNNSGSDISPVSISGATTRLTMLVHSYPPKPTKVLFNSGGLWFDCNHSFLFYAPTTDLTLNSGPHVCGSVAAKSLYMNSGSTISKSVFGANWELPGSSGAVTPHFNASDFLECVPVNTSTTPDTGC